MEALSIVHRSTPGGGEFIVDQPRSAQGAVLGELSYRRSEAEINIVHTGVDRQLEGRGVGKRLVAAAVDMARKEGWKIRARCSFAHAVLEKTPAYADVWLG